MKTSYPCTRSSSFLLLAVILAASASSLLSQEADRKGTASAAKRAGFADEAIGVQTKGQLQNLLMNYGQITDTRYEDVGNAPTETFFDFRYPRENFTGLCDDFALFFAIRENSKNGNQGNVIDGWTDNDNEDWIAKDGSYGRTHYNPALDPVPHAELKWNNATPYLAHSDLPDSWPVDASGTPFWPGRFRKNPLTGMEMPGEFASDRDIYLEFTDANNQQGDVIGLEVQMMSYSYGRVYAEDYIFYELFIINKSGRLLQGVYTGFYQDPDCSDYGQETLLLVDSLFADGSRVWSLAQRDFDGDIGGATVPNSLGITEDFTFGTVFFETPRNLGVTDFHYFVDSGPTNDHILWPIISSDPTNPNVAPASNYFHGPNPRMDDVGQITAPFDAVWIVATGPFDMAPDDTVKFVIAVLAGDDDADYYQNVWSAKQLYDAYFNGPAAPPSPTLSAVTGDRRVTLYWDDTPETAYDPSTGEQDFEGYKIYRSEDGGTTWGTKITDALGRTYGYVPVAQFDLNNNIKGPDPLNPLNWLGNDTGLRHSWVDSTVVNGITYSYTIVSYDRGSPTLFSLEGARGDGPEVKNFIRTTPTPPVTGSIPASLASLTHPQGSGDGTLSIEIINPATIRQNPYRVTIQGTPASTFSVERIEGSTAVPVLTNKAVNTPDLPVADGFRIMVSSDAVIGGLKSVTDQDGNNVLGVNNPSTDNSWYVSVSAFPSADTASKSTTYEVRFSDTEQALAYSWGLVGSVASFTVPFTVWDINNNRQVCFEVNDLNANQQWDEGETIFATRVPYPDPPPTPGSANPATLPPQFAYQIAIVNAPGDPPGNPPTPGSIVRVTSFNALRTGDVFEFTFSPATIDETAVDLTKIRVVPNPYIVVSRYEQKQNVREIRFMYLPPECTINVYTVSGILVKTLYHQSITEGSLAWNLVTDWNQALAFGVYVYVVEDPNGNRHLGKFALVK